MLPILSGGESYTYTGVEMCRYSKRHPVSCACVRACVRVCVRECVRMCIHENVRADENK